MKLIDPDSLNQGTEIVYDTTTSPHTLQLVKTGNLSDDGVTGQCIYSFTKEEWINDANLKKINFPFELITAEQGELVKDWDLKDATTEGLVRDFGWAVKSAGVSKKEFMCLSTLGAFLNAGSDLAYYLQAPSNSPVDILLTGPVNQAIQIYGDADNGDFDYRSYFQIFLREQGKTSDFYDLVVDQSLGSLTYKKYALPLSNALDLKITESDGVVDAYGVTITWYGSAQTRNIGGTDYDFSLIIDGNNKTAEEIYMAVQSALRKNTDIDAGAGTVRGDISEALLKFSGETLTTLFTSSGGIYIDNFQSTDTNRLIFKDDTDAERTYPFVSAALIELNENLQNDAAAEYTVYFEYTHSDTEVDFAITGASGINGTLNSTLVDLSQVSSGDKIIVSGFSNETNNGTFEATGNGTSDTVAIKTITGEDMVDESAGETVTLKYNPFGTSSAIIVKDNSGVDVQGNISGAESKTFDFDYDGNIQGGRPAGTDANIVIVALGLVTAQYALSRTVLSRSTSNSGSVVSSLERNYRNE